MEITFTEPYMLLLLFSLPMLVLTHFFWLRSTKRKAMKFANFRALKRITGKKLITKNYFLLFVRLVLLFCAILAAAGTTIWFEGDVNDNAFVLAIDTSASMRAVDIPPSRFEAAQEYAKLFVESVDSETSIGVLSFSGVTFIELVPTTDKDEVLSAIDDITVVEAGGTDIPGAIITSANLLVGNEKGKSIILITDGSNTLETFTSDSVQQGVKYALREHAIIYTIGIGSETAPIGYLPSYYNISSVYNEENLLAIANSTGGEYYHADDRESLLAAYDGIADQSHKAMIELPLAPGLMVLALILIFLDWGLISTRFRTIP
ncbi:VWA domain-containing protein [Candidatus Woesearchaeota archaeon]|nr:VWA domain-containing protein [Candidatus Woesearchaeota archaeon]